MCFFVILAKMMRKKRLITKKHIMRMLIKILQLQKNT